MKDLERKQSGDWYDIREAAKKHADFMLFIKPDAEFLNKALTNLRNAAEGGIVEAKKEALKGVFQTASDAQYRSIELSRLAPLEDTLFTLIFCIILQRMYVTGVIELKERQAEYDKSDYDLKSIMGDIQKRVSKNPETAKKQTVKNILVNMKLYSKELESAKSLTANLSKEKAKAVAENLKKRLAEITQTIQRNYVEILKEDEEKPGTEKISSIPGFGNKDFARVLTEQARLFTEFRAALQWVRKERYKVGETLATLKQRQQEVENLIQAEWNLYKNIGGTEEGARELSMRSRALVMNEIQKQLTRL
ncbi:MAG: hypothetical protein ACLFR1_05195 [Spirochaetia bacterium]